MIQRILLGYDGSESANQAFLFAVDLARKYSAELHVLAVVRPPELGNDVETEAIIDSSRRHHNGLLDSLKGRLTHESVNVQFQLNVGHPAEQIIRYAEAHGVDHIVVGHRGHTIFERWLIGSVARHVIAYAYCSVSVVRA